MPDSAITSPKPTPRHAIGWARCRRWLALAFIVAYLGVTARYLYRQLMGDTVTTPFGALFTWDMFPNYGTHQYRRQAIGLTRGGKFVRLVPGPAQRYRTGLSDDLTRLDLFPSIDIPAGRAFFRKEVEDALVRYARTEGADECTMVLLVESTHPVSFNLPDDLYVSEYGRRNPHRLTWRLVEQATVLKDGRPKWSQPR